MNHQERFTPGTSAPAEERSCSWLNIWVFLFFALTIKAAFVTICHVIPFCPSSEQPTALQQHFSEWKCDSAVPQGTGRGWTCCPKSWIRFQSSCYLLSLDTMSWAESEQNCTGMGSQLVVINSKAEQVFLSGQIIKEPERENFYIGLFADKLGQWQWVDKTPYNATAAFWRSGEPNQLPNETSTVMHAFTEPPYNWNDVIPDLDFHRICEAAAVTV